MFHGKDVYVCISVSTVCVWAGPCVKCMQGTLLNAHKCVVLKITEPGMNRHLKKDEYINSKNKASLHLTSKTFLQALY